MASSSSSKSKEEDAVEIPFFCTVCNRFMDDWNGLATHPHELIFRRRKEEDRAGLSSSTKCSFCGKECCTIKNLTLHQKLKHPNGGSCIESNNSSTSCSLCGKKCGHITNLRQHQKFKHPNVKTSRHPPIAENKEVQEYVNTPQSLHNINEYKCNHCESNFSALSSLKRHRRFCLPDPIANMETLCGNFKGEKCLIEPEQCAFDNNYRSILIKPSCPCITLEQFMMQVTEGMHHIINHCLKYGENIKAYVSIKVLMHKINISTGKVDRKDYSHFSSKAQPI